MFGVGTAFGFILRTSPAIVNSVSSNRISPAARKAVDSAVKKNQLRKSNEWWKRRSVTQVGRLSGSHSDIG